ncbi:putative TOS1-like glycosyl hydrolase-domain-containing protein [Boeremia exigua]|uniref:putative TOS1-like glycosyl hydrolase-domain-containing protein n=1 Tax=Boeremia exigua TaxID=749465 RepID=UPI001E8EE119|nr:putative TOS1-like glycosyl hydrolase-domain-containing protein [Boeremia exigua]KAH6638068.1 putative TOS1-like glycosyl hydrolase-domain-containing protein [Boeremia exigua]
MRHLLYLATFIPFAHSKTAGQLCAGTAELQAITYRNISQPGAYNRTTYVDPSTGICGHETVRYPATSSLTPLFGEVSMHLRGPMNISQLAVYQVPSEAFRMRKRSSTPFYNQRRDPERRSMEVGNTGYTQPHVKRTWTTTTKCDSMSTVTSTVTVTDCGTSSSSTPAPLPNTTYVGPPLPCLPTPNIAWPPTGTNSSNTKCTCQNTQTVSQHLGHEHPRFASRPTPAQQSEPATDVAEVRKRAGAWDRVAYYTSTAPAQATGFSFLANLGDPRQSGTFDYAFGNSLSFVTPAGNKVAPESQPFDGTLDTSEYEIAVFSDKQCDGNCPYSRPNATSHYGWSGSSKAFFIEFQMDHYQNRGSDHGIISDAPAWWFLNAAIPRILQYGSDRNNIPCSCWSTGCGEFDAFEVLGNGEERAKSTMHRQGNLEGGDSNYFKRPVGKKLKFAVVWHFPHITARVMEDDYEFPDSLAEGQIDALVAYDPDSWVHSMFPIGD